MYPIIQHSFTEIWFIKNGIMGLTQLRELYDRLLISQVVSQRQPSLVTLWVSEICLLVSLRVLC